MKRIYTNLYILGIIIITLVIVSYSSYSLIKNKEIIYETLDYESIVGIKNIFEEEDNISSELKDYIVNNMTNDGYCRLFLGYVQNLSNMYIEKWYKLSGDNIKNELSPYTKMLSQAAKKGWQNGLYVYIYKDGSIRVQIENVNNKTIVTTKYTEVELVN